MTKRVRALEMLFASLFDVHPKLLVRFGRIFVCSLCCSARNCEFRRQSAAALRFRSVQYCCSFSVPSYSTLEKGVSPKSGHALNAFARAPELGTNIDCRGIVEKLACVGKIAV